MQMIFIAETDSGRIKMTDDRDCLPDDTRRLETRIFANDAEILRAGFAYQKRGFHVCIDTATIDCFEFGPDELAQTQASPLRHVCLGLLALLILGGSLYAESKYYIKATHLGPGAVAVSCQNEGDPTIAGRLGGALIVSCGRP